MKNKSIYFLCIGSIAMACGGNDVENFMEPVENSMEPTDDSSGQDANLGKSGVDAEKSLGELNEVEYKLLCDYASQRIFVSEQTSVFCYNEAIRQVSVDDSLDCETIAQNCISSPELILSFVDCDEISLDEVLVDCSIDVELVEACADGYQELWDGISSTVDCSNVRDSLESINRMIPFECREMDIFCPSIFGIN